MVHASICHSVCAQVFVVVIVVVLVIVVLVIVVVSPRPMCGPSVAMIVGLVVFALMIVWSVCADCFCGLLMRIAGADCCCGLRIAGFGTQFSEAWYMDIIYIYIHFF